MAAAAVATVHIENGRVIVTEWSLPPGATTGPHRHKFDYVVVPQTTGQLELTEATGGTNVAELTAGKPYFRKAGVEHDVKNINDSTFVFVEIELK